MPRNSVPPKVSVLIPVYNVEKYVERCILSVLNQTMQEGVEVIIVNDCTPDRSMEIIRKLLRTHLKENGMMVSVVEHEKNRGQAAARNTLIKYAIGDYTIFVDSDDYVEPDMLEKMYAKVVETNADMVFADFWLEYIDKNVYVDAHYDESRRILLSNVIMGNCTNLWNKLIRRSLYIENNIEWSEGHDMSEDYTMMVPLCFVAQKIAYISSAFYHYVQYNLSSITKGKISQRELEGYIYAADSTISFFKNRKIGGYDKELGYILLYTRYVCLLHSGSNNKLRYEKLYPEANKYRAFFISNAKNLSLKIQYCLVSLSLGKWFHNYLLYKEIIKKMRFYFLKYLIK